MQQHPLVDMPCDGRREGRAERLDVAGKHKGVDLGCGQLSQLLLLGASFVLRIDR